MLALTTFLAFAACAPDVEASLFVAESQARTLAAEASQLKLPKERHQMGVQVTALEDALTTLRGAVGCHPGDGSPTLNGDFSRPSDDGVGAVTAATALTASTNAPLSDVETRALLSALSGEQFDDGKLAMLESGLSGRCVDGGSASLALGAFRGDASRLAAWRLLAPRLVDRDAGPKLVQNVGSARVMADAKRALLIPLAKGCDRPAPQREPDR